MDLNLLPGVPEDTVRASYGRGAGNEIDSGKFLSPESSSALVANTFGAFLVRPERLCPQDLVADIDPNLRAASVDLEAEMRFPWSGGRHPWLDVAIRMPGWLIGIEAKRYEPFRSKPKPELSDAYWRNVWGEGMASYQQVRDDLRSGALVYRHLDAAQLVKHALGLLTQADREDARRVVLVYLHAAPTAWADDRPIPRDMVATHAAEIQDFADRVKGDRVSFAALTYSALMEKWVSHGDQIAKHAHELRAHFDLG